MYKYEIHPQLDKKLKKLSKKDKKQLEAVLKKIEEIIKGNVEQYKNLKKPLQEYKRVHIYSSFVLLFKVKGEKIVFADYQHHDKVYK